MNNKKQQTNQSENTLTEIFKYEVKEGVSEFHVMIHSTRPEDTYEEQLNAVANAYNDLLAGELKGAMAVFKRYFLSDTPPIRLTSCWLSLPKVPTVLFPW